MNVLLKIRCSNGSAVYFNPDKVIAVNENPASDKKFWIRMPTEYVEISKEDYDIEDVLKGIITQEPIPEKKREEEKEEAENTAFQFPNLLTRYDFRYMASDDSPWEEAREFIDCDEACYFMDGDPLEGYAVKIPYQMSDFLIEHYDFNNPVRNLSWIRIGEGNHLALLFNNRAKNK